MPLHLVTQQNLPYGALQGNCEACGRACGPYWNANTRGHLWTDDQQEWSDDPINCLKVKDPNFLLCDGEPTEEQRGIYFKNNPHQHRGHLPLQLEEGEEDDD